MSKLKPISTVCRSSPRTHRWRAACASASWTGSTGSATASPPRRSCALYGVSRMTVRRAVTQLVQDGAVFTENGRGTFVKAPELGAATFDLSSLRRLVDDAATTVKIIVARIVPPSPRVCRKLALDTELPVVAIKRVLSSAGEPVFYHSEYLVFDPRRPLVEAEYGVTALRDLLANAGSRASSTAASTCMPPPSRRPRPRTSAKSRVCRRG